MACIRCSRNCLRITVGTPAENDELARGALQTLSACYDCAMDQPAHRESRTPQHGRDADRGRGQSRRQRPCRARDRRRRSSTTCSTSSRGTGWSTSRSRAQGRPPHRRASHGRGHRASRWARRSSRRSATRRGSRRYGHAYVPLDEALSRVVIDLSGRPGLEFHVPFTRAMIGTFDVDLTHEFFQGFVNHALVTLHIDNLRGRTRTTRPKRCSRRSRGRCAWPWSATRARRASFRRRRARSSADPRRGFAEREVPAGIRHGPRPSFPVVLSPMPDIAVVDYGMGNLRSVAKALVHVAPTAPRW